MKATRDSDLVKNIYFSWGVGGFKLFLYYFNSSDNYPEIGLSGTAQGVDNISSLYHVNMMYSRIFAMGNAFGSFSISNFALFIVNIMI